MGKNSDNHPDQLQALFRRYLDGQLSRGELAAFLRLVDRHRSSAEVNTLMDEIWHQLEKDRFAGPEAGPCQGQGGPDGEQETG